MINNKTPRHLAERVAAELLPDIVPGVERLRPGGEQQRNGPKDRKPVVRADEPAGRVDQPTQQRLLPEPLPSSMASNVTSNVGFLPLASAPVSAQRLPPSTGTIISRKTMEETGMVVARGRRDQAGEEFRIVRQQILQTMAATGSSVEGPGATCANVVMVTSARHGEGKSFTALNLANILAEGGERPVVLIDADIGDNSLSRHFGVEGLPGLLDLAVSPRQLAQAMTIPTEPENLTFIPIGGGTDAAARGELSSRQPIRTLIERLAGQFRDSIVVLDSPACLSNSDPIELAAVVGQIVLVVEAGQTRRKDVEGALDLIEACPNISLLLNRMTQRGRGSFAL